MSICPYCKSEINFLSYDIKRREIGNYHGLDNFEADESNIIGIPIFACPLCAHIITNDRQDADIFLNQYP